MNTSNKIQLGILAGVIVGFFVGFAITMSLRAIYPEFFPECKPDFCFNSEEIKYPPLPGLIDDKAESEKNVNKKEKN